MGTRSTAIGENAKASGAKNTIAAAIAAGLIALSSSAVVSATTITSSPPALDLNSVPNSYVGAQGYIFFSPGSAGAPDLHTLTEASPVSYVTLQDAPGTAKFGDVSYSAITIAGAPVHSGVLYSGNTTPGSPKTLLTIVLTDPVGGSTTDGAAIAPFRLGVYEDNASDPSSNDMSAVLLSLTPGTSGTLDSASLSQNVRGDAVSSTSYSPQILRNDFYLYTITGAHVGDAITVAPTNTFGGNIVLGGLTFDSVPEPTTLSAILLVSSLGLLPRRRVKAC